MAGGRPWNEGVGAAFGMGFANGAIDAFTDHYGDMVVEGRLSAWMAGGAAGVADVGGWRRPGDVDADGLRRLSAEDWDWLRGLPGDEQGSIRLGPAGDEGPEGARSKRWPDLDAPKAQKGGEGIPEAEPPRNVAEPRPRAASLLRQLGVGIAGIKKHVRAWFSRRTPNLDALPDLEAVRSVDPFNKVGAEKNIYNVLGAKGYSPESAYAELVWLQPKWWGGPNLMEGELTSLKMLEEYGLPTPRNLGKTEYTDITGIRKTAVIQERLAGGSRDYIGMYETGDLDGLRASPLNERTIQDLQHIKQTLVDQQLKIPDLQFLIAKDGRVVINDPQMPRRVAPGSDLGLGEIDDLIDVAQEAIRLRAQN